MMEGDDGIMHIPELPSWPEVVKELQRRIAELEAELAYADVCAAQEHQKIVQLEKTLSSRGG